MTRLEKAEYLRSQGYTYDPKTGNIYNPKGKIIKAKNTHGYIYIKIKRKYNALGHHFGWYMTYGNVDFEMLDHLNRDRADNKLSNLRIVDNQTNSSNQFGKGYSKSGYKWKSYITINYKQKHLGVFETQEEAHQAYIEEKKRLQNKYI
jgi:hypothetical protein